MRIFLLLLDRGGSAMMMGREPSGVEEGPLVLTAAAAAAALFFVRTRSARWDLRRKSLPCHLVRSRRDATRKEPFQTELPLCT